MERFAFWRRMRGGVHERWWVATPDGLVLRWFGPFTGTYDERVADLKDTDGLVLSFVRSMVLEHRPNDAPPTLFDLAKPSLRCMGGAPIETEDHRESLVNE